MIQQETHIQGRLAHPENIPVTLPHTTDMDMRTARESILRCMMESQRMQRWNWIKILTM